jgi:glycosyltransferase involved in cell wall biosynthesis
MSNRTLLFIPAYNCEKQIVRVLAQLDSTQSAFFEHVIVVNNRSTDGTENAALTSAMARGDGKVEVLRNRENYGLGGSHKVAFEYALRNGFDYVAVLHGDDQGRVADLTRRFSGNRAEQPDCLLGARFHPDSALIGYSPFRTLGNRLFNAAFSFVARRRLFDLGAGLNLYRTDILRDRFYERFSDDLTFNYCMILAHSALGHRIEFFPIEWREEDQVSNVRLVSQAIRSLSLLVSFAFGRRRFLASEHRAKARTNYEWDVVSGGGLKVAVS